MGYVIETETNYSKNTPLPRCTKFIVSGVRPSVHVRPSEGRSDVKKKRLTTMIRFCRITISTTPFLTRLARIDRCECPLSIGVILIKNGDVLDGETGVFWSSHFLRTILVRNWILRFAIRKRTLFATPNGPEQNSFFDSFTPHRFSREWHRSKADTASYR